MVQNISIPLYAVALPLLPPPASGCCLVGRVAPLAGGANFTTEAVEEDTIGEPQEGCSLGTRTKGGLWSAVVLLQR
jgi:hypothetical protein